MAKQELITMTQKELSRYETIKRLINQEINGAEAAKQLGLSIRQTKNIKAAVKERGAKGIIHGHRGKPSHRRFSDTKISRLKEIVKENYSDFGPTFASEKLLENHQIKISHEKLRQLMIGWKLWKVKPRKKNKEYRSWRPRKEQYGEMLQFDGSYHSWFEKKAPECCLLAAIDDATSRLIKLKFVNWEGVKPAFVFWKEYLKTCGKPVSIYLDKHSTYKQNAKSLFDDPQCLTQFERAMKNDLDIKILHAHSPQAKGRAERLFGTLQDRLVKELRLAGIKTKEEANRFAEQVFIPKFNNKFSVLPQRKGDLHRNLTELDKENLDKIFSIQNIRIIGNDFTVRFHGQWFQLTKTQPTLVLRKDKVLIEERIDETVFISLRNKYLDYLVLPERPQKVKEMEKVIGLTKKTESAFWKPALDHPWRQQFVLPKLRPEQTAPVN